MTLRYERDKAVVCGKAVITCFRPFTDALGVVPQDLCQHGNPVFDPVFVYRTESESQA